MVKKILNNDYGRRSYVNDKYDMRSVTEFTMRNEFLYRDSEFKKPYRIDSKGNLPTYAQMEYGWNPTHWDGGGKFDMPANFDATRNNGYPGLSSRKNLLDRLTCKDIGGGIGTFIANMRVDEEQTIVWDSSAEMLELVKESGVKIRNEPGTVFVGDGKIPNIKWSVDNADVKSTDNIDEIVITATGGGTIKVSLDINGKPCDEAEITATDLSGCTWATPAGAPAIYIGRVVNPGPDNGSYSCTSDYQVPTTAWYRLPAFNVASQIFHDLEYFYLEAGDYFGPYSWYCVNAVCVSATTSICGGTVTVYCSGGAYPQRCNI